jgi:hypothetical protein
VSDLASVVAFLRSAAVLEARHDSRVTGLETALQAVNVDTTVFQQTGVAGFAAGLMAFHGRAPVFHAPSPDIMTFLSTGELASTLVFNAGRKIRVSNFAALLEGASVFHARGKGGDGVLTAIPTAS